MRLQISSRLIELIIKIEIEVMRLQIHDKKYRWHRPRKLAKAIVDVLGLERNTLPKSFIVD